MKKLLLVAACLSFLLLSLVMPSPASADDASGGWDHINVDQISQSNTQAQKKPFVAPPGRGGETPQLENAGEFSGTGKRDPYSSFHASAARK